jgi:hypothetical protein
LIFDIKIKKENPYMTFYSFGVPSTGTELATGVRANAAYNFVNDNRDHIKSVAAEYGLDSLVLGNVLYQERRHVKPEDWAQDRFAPKNSGSTLGPGQITIKQLTGLIDRGKVHLSDAEQRDYRDDPKQFARDFLVDSENGIRATAALISDRLEKLQNQNKIPSIANDQNPETLSLGQFIYGAALYSKGGTSDDKPPKKDFDTKGPTTEQIDIEKNSISGLVGKVKFDEQIVFAFHYLPDTYEALNPGSKAPSTLGGYFNDRSILRQPDKHSSVAEPEARIAGSVPLGDRSVASGSGGVAGIEDTGHPLSRQYQQALKGTNGDRDAAALAVKTIKNAPGYKEGQDISVIQGKNGNFIVSQGQGDAALNLAVPQAKQGDLERVSSHIAQAPQPQPVALQLDQPERMRAPTM